MAEFFRADAEEIEALAAGSPADLTTAVKRAIPEVDSNLPITGVTTLTKHVQASFGQQRSLSAVTACFGFLGLVLACAGLHGIMAYSVARRTNEIGVRTALGVQRSDVLTLVVGRGMHPTIIGVAAGIAAALALTRFLSSLLYVVKPTGVYRGRAGACQSRDRTIG